MAADELDCAKRIVSVLFAETGLAGVLREDPTVVVGKRNWISFSAKQALSIDTLLSLRKRNGELAFCADLLRPGSAIRSRTTPSLHLTTLYPGGNLQGHVDACYWVKDPLGHAVEFLMRKTAAPSEMLSHLPFSL